MKESAFIRQNKENWQEFEDALRDEQNDPSRTSKLFIRITDDLAYARTFYPNRSVRLYLNGVARLLFNDLNKTGRKGWKDVASFWKRDLPLAIHRARRAMLVSFVVFVCSFIIGGVTSRHDPHFAAKILGKKYVDMTEENIRRGDPLAVYKSENEVQTFLPVLLNNLVVDFITFISGIFMAVGSIIVLIGNGVMVGVFHYFFYERNLTWESFLGIWTHGSLEIPTIVLAGGAGITFGRGLLFPGTYSRLQAFKVSAAQGLVIILGVAPLTFIAAFAEGFLTRHTDIPDAARLVFIVLSFSAVIAYYFFYPKIVARNDTGGEPEDHILLYKRAEPFDTGRIHTTRTIVSETFHQLFTGLPVFAKILLLPSLAFAILVAWNPFELFRNFDAATFDTDMMTNFSSYPFMIPLVAILSCITITWTGIFIKRRLAPEKPLPVSAGYAIFHASVTALVLTIVLILILVTGFDYAMLVCVLLLPFAAFVTAVSAITGVPVHKALEAGSGLMVRSPGKFLGTTYTFMIVAVVFHFALRRATGLLWIDDAISMIFTDDDLAHDTIRSALFAFQTALSMSMYCVLVSIASSVLYFTLHESDTAESLMKRIRAL